MLAIPLILLMVLSGCAASTTHYAYGSLDARYKQCNDLANAKGYVGSQRATFRTYCLETLSDMAIAAAANQSSPLRETAYKFAQGLEAAGAVGQGRTPLYLQEQQLGMTPYPAIIPYGANTQWSTIGQPDQFGPLGYRGPTWERYNQFFNNPPQH